MPRPKLRTAAVRAAVLEAALDLLEEEGAAACTTRRIAGLAGTSPAALYEFFGDKRGLLREVFFEGFRLLGATFAELAETDEPRADLEDALRAFRAFALDHPALTELMFSRPFASFDPSGAERDVGAEVRGFLIGRVRRCVEAEVLRGDPTDIAHGVLGLAMGLATQERGGWLGSSKASRERRWAVGVRALLDGLAR